MLSVSMLSGWGGVACCCGEGREPVTYPSSAVFWCYLRRLARAVSSLKTFADQA